MKVELSRAHVALQWRLVEGILFDVVGYPIGERRARAAVGFFIGESGRVDLQAGLSLQIVGEGVRVWRTDVPIDRIDR